MIKFHTDRVELLEILKKLFTNTSPLVPSFSLWYKYLEIDNHEGGREFGGSTTGFPKNIFAKNLQILTSQCFLNNSNFFAVAENML